METIYIEEGGVKTVYKSTDETIFDDYGKCLSYEEIKRIHNFLCINNVIVPKMLTKSTKELCE